MILKITLIFHGYYALIYINLNLFVKSILTLSYSTAKYSIKFKENRHEKFII